MMMTQPPSERRITSMSPASPSSPPRVPIGALLLGIAVSAAACASPARDHPEPELRAELRVPPPPAAAALLEEVHARARASGLEDRTFSPERWWEVMEPFVEASEELRMEEVGHSAEGRPLRLVSFGSGPVPVLLWSQMHGDESTASMALADLIHWVARDASHPFLRELGERLTVHMLPILNPDGAARFQRRNAQGVDINRDARALATPEGRTLKAVRDRLEPAFGFNLHDQAVGTRVGTTDRGTAIALLAPPFNEARDVNPVRQRAMEVAAVIRTALEPRVGGYMARWDDTFNPRAFGDLMTAWGTSTILIESGGWEGDPEKQFLRKLNFIGILTALEAIATESYRDYPVELYASLPQNGRRVGDLLIRDALIAVPGLPPLPGDVLVNFEHPLAERGGRWAEVGDLRETEARDTVFVDGLYLVPLPRGLQSARGQPGPQLAPGAPAHFVLSRDPEGRDVVWEVRGDVDPERRRPEVRQLP
jgi:hypothetical protein